MLRAGLIGFPSSGKTALFQLLTSAREAPRTGGRQEANVGVSRVPDERLNRLSELFKPRKHTPATVEFADMGGTAGAKTGAAALLDVAPFRNADALLHVVRMFRDPSVPHAAGSVDPARDVRTMEDEIILADLGVVDDHHEHDLRSRRDLGRIRAARGSALHERRHRLGDRVEHRERPCVGEHVAADRRAHPPAPQQADPVQPTDQW